MNFSCKSKNIVNEIQLKELSLGFWEKKQLENNGKSVLIALLGLLSIWRSESDLFQ